MINNSLWLMKSKSDSSIIKRKWFYFNSNLNFKLIYKYLTNESIDNSSQAKYWYH